MEKCLWKTNFVQDAPQSQELMKTSTKSMPSFVKTVAEQLCEMSGMSWSSIQRILSEDLHMRRVAAKFVPRLLTDEQRERRLQACFELQNQLEEDPEFFSKVITGD